MRDSNKNLAISLLGMLSFFALLAAFIILLPSILSLWPTPDSLTSVNLAQSQSSAAAVVAVVAVVITLAISKRLIWLAGIISPLLLWLSLNTFARGVSSLLTEVTLLLSMPIVLLVLRAFSRKKVGRGQMIGITVLGVTSTLVALYSWFI